MEGEGKALTGKNRDLVNVMEFSKIFAVETGPEVCDEDLSPLVQPHPSPIEHGLVAETGKILHDEVDKTCSRVVGAVDAVCKTAAKFL